MQIDKSKSHNKIIQYLRGVFCVGTNFVRKLCFFITKLVLNSVLLNFFGKVLISWNKMDSFSGTFFVNLFTKLVLFCIGTFFVNLFTKFISKIKWIVSDHVKSCLINEGGRFEIGKIATVQKGEPYQ